MTVDTITDDDIRALRAWAKSAPAPSVEGRRELLGLVETCTLALGETKLQRRTDVHAFARERCAMILRDRSSST